MRTKTVCRALVWALVVLCLGVWPAAASGSGEAASGSGDVLTVDEAIQLALKNSLEARMEAEKLAAAALDLEEAMSATSPSVSVTVSPSIGPAQTVGGPEGDGNGVAGGVTVSGKVTATLRKTLPFSYKAQAALEQARLNNQVTVYNSQKSLASLASRVQEAYIAVLKAQETVSLDQSQLESAQENLRIIREKQQAGVASGSDVERADLQVKKAEQNLNKARNALVQARSALNVLLGLPWDTEFILSGEGITDGHPAAPPTLEDAVAEAYENRVEILAAEAAVRKAEIGLALARGESSLQFSASAQYGIDGAQASVSITDAMDFGASLSYSPDGSGNRGGWSVGLQAVWDLSAGGSIEAGIERAMRSLVQSQLALDETKQNIALEVQTALMNLAQASAGLETAALEVSLADEDLETARLRLERGLGTNVEVMNAQIALAEAKSRELEARYDYHLAWVRLENAIGRSTARSIAGGDGE